jgi:hypothetical protein
MKQSSSQLITECAALRARVAELEAALAERRSVQQNLHDLAERVRTEYSTLSRLKAATIR